MAVATTQVLVRPEEGWKLAATAPSIICIIKPNTYNRWFYALAGSTPAATVNGIPMGVDKRQDNELQIVGAALTGINVYVRVAEAMSHYMPYDPSDKTKGATTFNVVAG